MFGLKEYYDSLLLEAKSPEEIKKILEYQFVKGKGVPEDVLDYIFAARPVNITTNGMTFDIGDYRVVYSPLTKNPQESISIIRDYTTKDVPDNVRSEIFGIFYPSIARVQNSFNDTLNKMTVTERRNRYEKIN